MALDTALPQDGPSPPPFNRSNTSLYFDAMPSMSSIFNRPRGQSRSSSPERPIKQIISAPIPIDSAQISKPMAINGHTNIGGKVEDDENTLRAGGSMHGGGVLPSESPRQFPYAIKTDGTVGENAHGNESAYDVSSPASGRKRSFSHSEDHGGATDDTSIRSVPVLYTNMVPEGEGLTSNHSQQDVSRKVSVKRSPSKLVKRRGTKGKQTETLVYGGGSDAKRSASRNSQRSFRSGRGPVFDMVTAPPNAAISDTGGAFGTGAVMAAPENEIEDELQSGLQERVTIAESALTRKQTTKIQKEECTRFDSSPGAWSLWDFLFLFRAVAVSKTIYKIVDSEGKAEKNSLKAAIGELKGIQKMQRVAVKVTSFF